MPYEILNHQRLSDKLEHSVVWSIFYHLFYQIFAGYLYQYMIYKRKQKSSNGWKKPQEHLMTLKAIDKPPSSVSPHPRRFILLRK